MYETRNLKTGKIVDAVKREVAGSQGQQYVVSWVAGYVFCTCLGYVNRQTCKHSKALKEEMEGK